MQTDGARSRVKCLVPERGARRNKALDEVSAAIPCDAERRKEQSNKSNLTLVRPKPLSDPIENEVTLEEALEVIRWYQYQINIKLMRAIESKKREVSLELNDFPKDSDGSAKVALLGIDRSISSWNELLKYLPEQKERILNLSVHLNRLRKRVESEFPNARAFIRPGFDEVNNHP